MLLMLLVLSACDKRIREARHVQEDQPIVATR